MKKFSFLVLIIISVMFNAFSQSEIITIDRYITGHSFDEKGREILQVITPSKPPADFRAPVAEFTRNAVVLGGVPAYSWSFGCSPTAASMAAGFYDNNGYSNVYSGPANGGNMPMNNSSWGSVVINGETRDLCPLSATMLNLDGRITRGHVDDYWTSYGSQDPDPYIINGWTQHAHNDCLGDFMGTNQSAVGSTDGSTTFFFYGDGSPIVDYAGAEPEVRDGCHGMRLFYESRGYTVQENYTQLIYGQDGNTLGFTFSQYMNEIDNGRPVIIQVSGHSMLGYGYDETGSIVYLHDTWDYQDHSMVWGTEYAGMAQWGVTVLELLAYNSPPIANFSGSPTSILTGESVTFTDLSAGNPTSWQWSFEGGNPSLSVVDNPVVIYSTAGVYTVTLVATNSNGSDTEIKTGYIIVTDPDYCDASATCDEYIASMLLNTINNTSQCSTNGYSDYTFISTTLIAGNNYTIQTTTGPLYSGDQCGAWIDWNQDLDFDDDGEYFPMSDYPFTGTISIPVNALNGSTRLRVRILYTGDVVPCGNVEWGETEDYTVIVVNPQSQKTLNINVMLQALFDPGTNQMRKAQDAYGNHFAGNIADQINVKLMSSTPPFGVVTEFNEADLNMDGGCSINVPSAFNGNYYIVVKHRNSIESWSALPVSFSGSMVSYDFTNNQAATFGNNALQIGAKFYFYGGDTNQDGIIDIGDMTPVDNDAAAFTKGYLTTDVNGDGTIDIGDMTIIENNSTLFAGSKHP